MNQEVSSSGKAQKFPILVLTTLGVVYGDIGTSPLYAIRECFTGHSPIPLSPENILGVLSLIFWALTLIVTFYYINVVLRADNRGEGGVLALMALAARRKRQSSSTVTAIISLGLFGAALLLADGMLTPAISVLSAVEGIQIVTHTLDHFVIPITLIILFGIFYLQKKGTAKIGIVFGPIILFWFLTLATLGITSILKTPEVLAALNPIYAFHYFQVNGFHGLGVLGAVFLVLTGAEALYADMGHFGRRAIQYGWLCVAFPALTLNYFGQGALLLRDPTLISHPFFHLAPDFMLIPLVVLATIATIIASQAVISGAFSITRQAVQLGYLPRLEIVHTSNQEIGQIYIPLINWFLFIVTVWLVVTFQSSSALASAYGIAVVTTMIITGLLLFQVLRLKWEFHFLSALALITPFLLMVVMFYLACMLKILEGGYVPLLIGFGLYALMATWKRGREILAKRLGETLIRPEDFFEKELPGFTGQRLDGQAVFMVRSTNLVPPALINNLKFNKVLHKTVVLLSVRTLEIPIVSPDERVEVRSLGQGFYQVFASYGFVEDPDVPAVLLACAEKGLRIDPQEATYYLSRETLISTPLPGMAAWRERLFAFMTRNAFRAAVFYKIPSDRVVELGMQLEI